MIKIENVEVTGWEHAIRGMRNPMNSWEKSDSKILWTEDPSYYDIGRPDLAMHMVIGPNDHDLMMKLSKAGADHRKFMRMIIVYVDITAPLYWWKEFKTYRAGRKFGDPEPDIIDPDLLENDIETNSCSTMHKIHEKEFTLKDFSTDHLLGDEVDGWNHPGQSTYGLMWDIVDKLNECRELYLKTKDKKYWWQMIQLLPSSYNQRRTVMLNYEVLANIYKSRRSHKLNEWVELCKWIESLPYSELITGDLKREIDI